MKRVSESIASSIVNIASKNPQAAWDAVNKLVNENKQLKNEIKEILKASEIALKELKRIDKGNESHESRCVSQLAIGLLEDVLKGKGN